MNPQQHWMAQVDGEGRLVIPAELAGRFGLKPGAEVRLDESLHEIRIRRPVMALARLYLEVTNSCNLDCLICMRSVWDEPPGVIAPATFERLLEGLRAFSPRPTVFIGGFGEPLAPPVTAATWQTTTWKTAWATPGPPAAAVCGRRD